MKFEIRMLICFGAAFLSLLPIDLFLFHVLTDVEFQIVGTVLGLAAGMGALVLCLHWEERADAKRID